MPLDRASLRKLLGKVFPDDSDLDAFCIDHFPDVGARFTNGMDRVAKINLLFKHAEPEPILEVLQRSDFLQQLVPVLTRSGGVHVIIGRENANDAMHEVSLVFAPYGAPDRALGMLGVLGPTRMRYPRAIPTVRYLSGLMNELINSHYSETQ